METYSKIIHPNNMQWMGEVRTAVCRIMRRKTPRGLQPWKLVDCGLPEASVLANTGNRMLVWSLLVALLFITKTLQVERSFHVFPSSFRAFTCSSSYSAARVTGFPAQLLPQYVSLFWKSEAVSLRKSDQEYLSHSIMKAQKWNEKLPFPHFWTVLAHWEEVLLLLLLPLHIPRPMQPPFPPRAAVLTHRRHHPHLQQQWYPG